MQTTYLLNPPSLLLVLLLEEKSFFVASLYSNTVWEEKEEKTRQVKIDRSNTARSMNVFCASWF